MAAHSAKPPLPVTVLSGFLGSGKTTLLRRLLRIEGRRRGLGVIVNDLSELDVDGDLVAAGEAVSTKDGTLARLSHGAAGAAGTHAAFTTALDAMAVHPTVRHLLIETSGGSHPWALVETLAAHGGLRIDAFVVLLDALSFARMYDLGVGLLREVVANRETGRRTAADLLAEQLGFASTILLTKVDFVSADDLAAVTRCARVLNPRAAILTAAYGDIDPACLLDGGDFSIEHARQSIAHTPIADAATLADTAGYDLEAEVLRDPRPFHPQRLWRLVHEKLGLGVFRSKGFCWFPTRPDEVLLWSQAGSYVGLELLGFWKAALAADPNANLLPEERDYLRDFLARAHPVFGDRKSEVTVIGTARDRTIFLRELHACLCTDGEIARWRQKGDACGLPDPWPKKLRQVGA